MTNYDNLCKTLWTPGAPLIALSSAPGGPFDSHGLHPPISIMVVFETFDGMLHYGETLSVSDAGKNLSCRTAFFDRIDGVPRVYFAEYVKCWALRSHDRLTELPYTVIEAKKSHDTACISHFKKLKMHKIQKQEQLPK